MPLAAAWRASSGQVQRARGVPLRGGQLTRQGLDLGHGAGVEHARPARTRRIGQPAHACRSTGAATCGRCPRRRRAGQRSPGPPAVRGQQHDPRPQHQPERGRRTPGKPTPAPPGPHHPGISRTGWQARDSPSLTAACPLPTCAPSMMSRPRRARWSYGQAARVHQYLAPPATGRPRGGTLAPARRHQRPLPRRVRLRHRPAPRRQRPAPVRLRYAGPASTWGFAIYRASHDDYDKSVLPSGYPAGSRRKPSTAPAASTSATSPPGSTRHPRRINGRDH